MGISFKVSKIGKKYKPKVVIQDTPQDLQPSTLPSKILSNGRDEEAVGLSGSSVSSERHHNVAEDEVSFILNLYPDGYSIAKPSENDSSILAGFQEGSKILHPYDRASESLFTAIESGRLPGSILDDIPCKYVEGALTCEVRDYRKCMSDSRSNISSSNGSAIVRKVRLKMSLENVVNDIPLIVDDSWTYGDRMEVESRIIKALQPNLCLDPEPKLERLCKSPLSVKLDMGLSGAQKRRLRQIPEVTVTSNARPHGKKICIDRAPESSNYRVGELGPTSGDVMSQHVHDNVAVQGLAGNQRNMHDPALNAPGASTAGHDMQISYGDSMTSAVLGKMESQEAQLSQYPNVNKRARVGPDGAHHQQIGSIVDGLQGSDAQWRNQQSNARGIQYPNNVMSRYPQLVGEGITNQDGVKLEKADPSMVKTDVQMMEAEGSYMDPRLQQRFQQHPLMRPGAQQVGWNIHGQQVDKDVKKEEQFSKRKSIQSPRFGTGASAQSPLTMKSTEVSCGSMGTPYGAASSAAALGQLQREKSGVATIPAGVRSTSITSSGNDSMQLQNQAQLGGKRRSNSLPKTPIISGVGSPASVNTMGGPMNASSPSVSTSHITEQNMLEKFAKIEMVAMRHQLNNKKNKVEDFARKPRIFSSQASQQLQFCLTSAWSHEYTKDEISTSMSKSLVGGSLNVCKIRVVTAQSQANMLPVPVRPRLILSEKPNDGTVAMHYGEIETQDYLNVEDHLPVLPNTHLADLLATQFSALMNREGYFIDDQVQPRPTLNNVPSNTQPNAQAVTPNSSGVDMQQYSESVSGAQTSMETKPNIYNTSLNSTQNMLPSSGMLPPGNMQGVQMSQAHLSGVAMPARPQQMDSQQPAQQQQPQQLPHQNQPSLMSQQQPTQFQRSPLMLPTNSMSQLNAFGTGSNLPLGNKPNPLQMLQQPQQPPQQQQPQSQQQAQMQRRMMMGLGPTMSMGNIGNNVVGLGGLGNVMGIGAGRGIGGAGISAPMGAIAGIGTNMGQNPINMSTANAISQHLRAGNLTQQQQMAVAQRIKYMQSRGMFGGTQPGMPAMSGVGARQMQPGSGATGLSMLGQSLNRGNISPMQRTMGQMGLARLMPGMNVPMNQQQQQFQLQQQQLQQQQQQQPQQLQQQQIQQQMPHQEATSPLQAVVSPQQVGSPSTLVMPQPMNSVSTITQQQASPQQMGQRTPMSPPLSSGPMHPMSGGNPEACPASPALSSQTLGSVGSITNSPMDLQGVNKSNSVTNT